MVRQRGHILWSLLVLLGLMTELTLYVVNEVATQSQSAQQASQKLQSMAMINAVFHHLDTLPVPRLSSAMNTLWHPSQSVSVSVCGAASNQQGWQGTACHEPKPAWQWWLSSESQVVQNTSTGTDLVLLSQYPAQHWILRVKAGRLSVQQHYRQTVLP